jgi:hypothetical protein
LLMGQIAARRIAAEPNPFIMRRMPIIGSRRRRRRQSSIFCRWAQTPTPWTKVVLRLCTERCEHVRCPQSERSWMAAPTRGRQIRPGPRPYTSPSRPRGEEGAVLITHACNRHASSGCCWNEEQARPTKTSEANRSFKRRPASGFGPC